MNQEKVDGGLAGIVVCMMQIALAVFLFLLQCPVTYLIAIISKVRK